MYFGFGKHEQHEGNPMGSHIKQNEGIMCKPVSYCGGSDKGINGQSHPVIKSTNI